jgi:hypothetical protein
LRRRGARDFPCQRQTHGVIAAYVPYDDDDVMIMVVVVVFVYEDHHIHHHHHLFS